MANSQDFISKPNPVSLEKRYLAGTKLCVLKTSSLHHHGHNGAQDGETAEAHLASAADDDRGLAVGARAALVTAGRLDRRDAAGRGDAAAARRARRADAGRGGRCGGLVDARRVAAASGLRDRVRLECGGDLARGRNRDRRRDGDGARAGRNARLLAGAVRRRADLGGDVADGAVGHGRGAARDGVDLGHLGGDGRRPALAVAGLVGLRRRRRLVGVRLRSSDGAHRRVERDRLGRNVAARGAVNRRRALGHGANGRRVDRRRSHLFRRAGTDRGASGRARSSRRRVGGRRSDGAHGRVQGDGLSSDITTRGARDRRRALGDRADSRRVDR